MGRLFHTFKVLALVFLAPILVFLVHSYLAFGFGIYAIYPNFDLPAHFIGGFSMGLSFMVLLKVLQNSGIIPPLRSWLSVWMAFCSGVLVAVLYELLEFAIDLRFGTQLQMGLIDTNVDLLLGTLGALLAAILFVRLNTKRTLF